MAKRYHEEKSPAFENALKQAAIYAPSRKKLYHYINIEKKSFVEKISEIVLSKVRKPKEKEASMQLKEAASSDISLPHENTTEVDTDLIEPHENKVETQEKATTIQQTVNDDENNNDETHSFVDWLNFIDDDPTEIISNDALDQQFEQHQAAITYEADMNSELKLLREQKKQQEIALSNSDKEEVDQLAKGSILLKTGTVTETLAKIMLMQGKINDAIAIYEALSLKFPEKSNYFAAQVVKIKNN